MGKRFSSTRVTSSGIGSARIPWARSRELDRAIEDIVRRWVGPPLLAVITACQAACVGGGDFDPPGRDRSLAAPLPDVLGTYGPDLPAEGSGFLPATCDPTWDPMPNVVLAQAFDYQALRRHTAPTLAVVYSENGERCATAVDPAACAWAFNEVPAPDPAACAVGPCDHFVTTTLGDAVRHWTTRADLLALLGPIDAPEDALLLVYFDGISIGHGADPCTSATVREVADGYQVYTHGTVEGCTGISPTRALLHVSVDGRVDQLRSVSAPVPNGCPGRRPEGFREQPVVASTELGAFFAQSAQLEAAAVFAFERMLDELHAHGAPAGLIAQARAAREDEARHAWQMGALAARFGAAVPAVAVDAPARRSLLAMAIENAIEGCVNETWAAVVATHQAARAADLQVRAALSTIADDERRHAALSWRLGAWLDTRLPAHEKTLVAHAYRGAIAELREAARWPASAELVRSAGLPDAETALALVDSLCATVFTA